MKGRVKWLNISARRCRITEETLVFPEYVGTAFAANLPLFGDDVWDLRALRVRRNQPLDWLVIDFRAFPDPIRRLTAKEYLYVRLHLQHPQHRRLESRSSNRKKADKL